MNNNDKNNWWDYYSDQPYVMGKGAKPRLNFEQFVEFNKTLLTLLSVSPALIWRYYFQDKSLPAPSSKQFIGLSISENKRYNSQIIEMIDDLGVEELLIRVPAWDLRQMDRLLSFADKFKSKSILINVLQNRQCVDDLEFWSRNVKQIIASFSSISNQFQIGNAINRSKWGCFNTSDYFKLQCEVEKLRSDYPNITILGSSVIDFEPLITLRTLINHKRFHLDGCASLLYVNRRLSPYNKQFKIFDLDKKIRLIHAILSLSNRCEKKLLITETNWPLLNTRPYTPNSGNPRSTVDEDTQARFLTQYYKIAYQGGLVEKVYWWQLINPGYGLVDSRGQGLRKMPSYYAFKTLCKLGIDCKKS